MSAGGPPVRFDDGKEAQALRTIGEVAKALGLRQHVLRYWEQQFPMLQPLKRSGGRRYYRPEDVALVQTIDRLVNREGYTLKGARQALAGGAVQPAAETPAKIEVADILPHLRAIRDRLARALEAA
jgi:DNA-binding transcriptional MerR regulator